MSIKLYELYSRNPGMFRWLLVEHMYTIVLAFDTDGQNIG